MNIIKNRCEGFSETGIILAMIASLIGFAIVIKLFYSLLFGNQSEMNLEPQQQKQKQTADHNDVKIKRKMIIMGNAKVSVVEGTGYPTADNEGIGTAIRFIAGFTPTYVGSSAVYNFSSGTIVNCNVIYNHFTGRVILNTQGC